MSWVFDFRMSRSLIRIVCTYSDFFLVCIFYKPGLQIICLLFQTILDLWAVLILEVFSSEILKRITFNPRLYLITYFGHRQCFIWGILVFTFLVFSVYKEFKFDHHLLFLVIFSDLQMIQFWSVNYVCQVCKLYLLFRFSKFWVKTAYFQLLLNIHCSHCTQKYIFLYFLETKNPCFLTKNCSKSPHICVFILSKKTAQLIIEKLP